MDSARQSVAWTIPLLLLAACTGSSGGSQPGGGTGNQPPVAVLTLTKAYGVAPLVVTVDTAGSSDPDGTIASVRIDFGDGATLSAASGSHTYASIGGFTVTATVTDDDGATGTASAQVVTSATGDQTLVPRLVASRTSGYAPLAVHFDATGATSAVPSIGDLANGGTFRQIKHAFDFGDPGSGTHSLDGMSRNSEPLGGGLAAHVFDTPGTYTVTVTSTDGVGTPVTASVQITVDDPSALPTYAISKAGDFTGAPAGSTHLTLSTLPDFASNSRYFFRRGEDWSGSEIVIGDNLANLEINSYGDGPKPIFDNVNVGPFRPATSNFANDIRICNLQTNGNGGFDQEVSSRVLFYRCDAKHSSGTGLSYAPVDQYRVVPQELFENARELFYVDCRLLGDGTRGEYRFYGNGSRLVFLDTLVGGSTLGTARVVSWERGVMRHCRVENPYQERSVHALKLHSLGPNPYADNWLASGGQEGWRTSKVVIANSLFGGGNDGLALANWTVAICPQNDGRGLDGLEPIEDVILEGNTFIHQNWNGDGIDIARNGRRITTRNNTVQGGGTLVVRGGHAQAAEWDGPYFSE